MLVMLVSAIHPSSNVSAESGDQPDHPDMCETEPCANPSNYCVGTKVPGGYNCIYNGSCAGCVTLNCGTGTKLPDCSGAANYCTTYSSPNGCGTCTGTKQPKCPVSCTWTRRDTTCGTDGCGGICYGLLPVCSPNGCAANTCVGQTCFNGCINVPGTKRPDCSDSGSHCSGTTYSSSNGCGTCTGTKTCPVCGNGKVETGESCDNGSSNGSCPSACSSSCTVNSCSGGGSIVCGNGIKEGAEQCDNGSNNGTCPKTCSTSCKTNSCPVCGNGVVESGEACDNGISNGACPKTCSTSCTNNSCGSGIVCGNGIKEGTEQCDNGSSNGSCPNTCSASCTNNSCVCTPNNSGCAADICIGGGSCWDGCNWIPGTKNCPSSPLNLSASCDAGGTISLSWSGGPSSPGGYLVRIDETSNNGLPGEIDGWYLSNPPDLILNNYIGSSYSYGGISGKTYNTWVHPSSDPAIVAHADGIVCAAAPSLPPPSCTPDCSCSSNTCVGLDCDDGCGGKCAGIKPALCPAYNCNGTCGKGAYAGTCGASCSYDCGPCNSGNWVEVNP